jgi:pSer/pThr/pTyr-binding forkhead associated (FHA) protein
MTAVEAGSQSNAYVIHEFERRAYRLSDIPVRIGRDAANDIVLREGAVSRFNTEVRRENDHAVLYSPGSTPTLLDGVPIVDQAVLKEGAKIEVGSAVLTYTEKRLPIGVSVVERANDRKGAREDVINRRDTIKHPLIKGPTAEQPADPLLRAKVMTVVLIVVALLYIFGR